MPTLTTGATAFPAEVEAPFDPAADSFDADALEPVPVMVDDDLDEDEEEDLLDEDDDGDEDDDYEDDDYDDDYDEEEEDGEEDEYEIEFLDDDDE